MLATILAYSCLSVLQLAFSPYAEAKKQTLALAKDYAHVEQVDNFSIYNGKSSYYSLLGRDATGKELGLLVETGSDKIYTLDLSQGTSKERAEDLAKENGAEQIDKVTLGYFEGQPIWEVRSGKTYYLVAFNEEKILSKEGL